MCSLRIAIIVNQCRKQNLDILLTHSVVIQQLMFASIRGIGTKILTVTKKEVRVSIKWIQTNHPIYI